MTLQEALKSGRRIRNCDVGKCVWFDPSNDSLWRSDYVLSDLWEVESAPKKKEIRWLWAGKTGAQMVGFYRSAPEGCPIKLEWSATEFIIED